MKKSLFIFFALSMVLFSCGDNDDDTIVEKPDLTVVKSIYIDNNGNKWFGTANGLVFLKDTVFTVYTPSNQSKLAGVSINSLDYQYSAYSQKHELWIATNKGVTVSYFNDNGLDATSGATIYRMGLHDDGKLLSDSVLCVHVDDNGTRWFGTSKGLVWFKGETWGNLFNIEPENKIAKQTVRTIASVKDGQTVQIYAGTAKGVGVINDNEVDGVSGATLYETWGPMFSGTSENVYEATIIDGTQYYGTEYGIATKFGYSPKDDWGKIDVAKINDSKILCLKKASNGNLWVGTEKDGLFVITPSNTVELSFSTSNGMPSNTIYDVALDANNTVYVGTNNGLVVIKNNILEKIYTKQ